jgi:drug/metabolite transporter (DMT)-like permease
VPEPASRGPALRVALAFLCVYLIWGSTFLVIRVALRDLPPLFLCGVRLLIGGALLGAIAWRARLPRPRGVEWRNAAAVGLLLPAIGNSSVTLAETHVPSGLVALLVATIPMWMAWLGTLGPHGTPLTRRVLAGLVVGFAGIALLVRPGPLGGAHDGFVWVLLPILGSLSWAWGSLWSRHARLPSPMVSTAVGLTAGGVVMLAASGVTGEWARLGPAALGWRPVAAVLYLAVFGSVVGFTAYLWLLRHVTPSRVSTYAFVNPVVAMSLGVLIAGEPLDSRVAIASALVVVAVALIVTAPTLAHVVPTARPAPGDGENAATPAA